jgi:hypothetical protein
MTFGRDQGFSDGGSGFAFDEKHCGLIQKAQSDRRDTENSKLGKVAT